MKNLLLLFAFVGIFGLILFLLSLTSGFEESHEKKMLEKRENSSSHIDLNDMSRTQFARYCLNLLPLNGFEYVRSALDFGDKGLDLFANKNNETYGIRGIICNKPTTVGTDIILQAMTGAKFYGCDWLIIICNWDFDDNAKILAARENVILWNRSMLTELIHKDETAICTSNEIVTTCL